MHTHADSPIHMLGLALLGGSGCGERVRVRVGAVACKRAVNGFVDVPIES